jgi:hypothetical protein
MPENMYCNESKRIYYQFDPASGYPAGNGMFYECLGCNDILPSLPKVSIICTCKNISIDVDYGRISIKNNRKTRGRFGGFGSLKI